MFCCRLCDGILSTGQEILATYCGHVFHHDCLNYHFITRSTHCPTCRKSLRVDQSTAFTASSSYAIFSIDPYERERCDKIGNERLNNIKFNRDAVFQENIILKSKLTKALKHLVTLQAKLKPNQEELVLPKCQNRFEPTRSTDESYSCEESSLNIEFHAIRNQNLRNSVFKSKEKNNFIIRSRQRKYLTWRNKAQSWLSKMMTGCERLLQAEKDFIPHEYVQQLRAFMARIYKDGEVIEKVKQAATMYLIIADPSDAETNEIESKVIQLTNDVLQMTKRVLNKLHQLENLLSHNKDLTTKDSLKSQNLLMYLEKAGIRKVAISEAPVYV